MTQSQLARLHTARQHELSELGKCIIVGVRKLKHSISIITKIFEIPRLTISRMYRKYSMEDITAHRGQQSNRLPVLNGCDQKC